ncbi:MAG: hypothetical protein ABIQ95_02370 [Bdellovibrionia bacterium]
MFEKVGRSVRQFFSIFEGSDSANLARNQLRVIRKGPAMRVIFFYPGEEGTYVDHADVILYENGIVHITSNQEETTTHLQNCEILWRFETDAEDRANKVRLLKPKVESRTSEEMGHKADGKIEGKSIKTGPSKSPELID